MTMYGRAAAEAANSPAPSLPSGDFGKRWIARLMAGLAFAFTLFSIVLYSLNPGTQLGPRWAVRGFLGLFAVTFTIVGLLITHRQPRNLIGWLFSSFGLISALQFFTDEYAILALLGSPGLLPGGAVMGWFGNWIWILFAVSAWIYTPMLFPDGHLPSRSWRAAAALGVPAMALLIFVGQLEARAPTYTVGDWKDESGLAVPIGTDGNHVLATISLGARRNGSGYTEQDRLMLEQNLAAVERALALAQNKR